MAQAKKKQTTSMSIMFDRENPTKNKQRFEERGGKKDGMIGILYIDKKLDEELGEPDSLKVTLTPGD